MLLVGQGRFVFYGYMKSRLMKRSPRWEIVWIFLATRFILFLVTYFGSILLIQNTHANTSVTFTTMFTSWNRWDALVYIRIAQSGYHPPLDLAFFPLYPLLIAAIAHPL